MHRNFETTVKFAAAFFLGCAHLPTFAEWTEISRGALPAFYYEPESVRRNGVLARIWTVAETPSHEKVSKSMKTYWEFNCDEEKTRVLAIVYYAEPMGVGAVTKSFDEDKQWRFIPPKTAGSRLMELACK